jgi:capsular exopolysaccharide synthesis family protein
MSHIFDALLKSETNRDGKRGATPASITEVLQQAEQRAAAEWKARNARLKGAADPDGSKNMDGGGVTVGTEDAVNQDLQQIVAASPGVVEESYSFLESVPSIPLMLSPDNRLVAYTEKESAAAEAFRLLAVRLRHIRRDRQLKKVLVTSTVPEEGKSLVSANLACTIAAVNTQRVPLLEADVRRPSLTQMFQFSRRPGLCEWLKGGIPLEECIYRLSDVGIWIVPAGRLGGDLLELIQSQRLALAVEKLQSRFDWIIIDTPPVLPLADTSIVAKLADGIILVTRRGVTEKKQMLRGIEALDQSKLLGTVINSSRKSHHDYYYHNYHSHAGTDPSSEPSP